MAENEEIQTPEVEAQAQVAESVPAQAATTTNAQAAEETISLEEAKKLRREAQSLRGRLAKFEEAEKQRQEAELSELDKLKKQLAEKEAALKLQAHKDLQRQAADKVGLPALFAERLKGETLEELEEDAKVILEALPKAQKPQVGPTNPGSNATGQGETDEQRLARIHGRGINIFDPAVNKKMGGGVFTVTKD
jgi:hypothetical protein